MSKRIAVIGAGLTGTSFLWQLASRLEDSKPQEASIDIFERHADPGPGLPHNPLYVLPCHITNMCARDMGIVAEDPRDFQTWVDAWRARAIGADRSDFPEAEQANTPDPDCQHYPRAWMGEYLKARFTAAVGRIEAAGVRVRVRTRCEVTDLRLRDSSFELSCTPETGSPAPHERYDRVLLATGHWFSPQTEPRVIPSPWPASRLAQQIPPGAEVAVLGSSLSAIETVLALTLEGTFSRANSGRLVCRPGPQPRRLTLLSRRGQLPRVRGRLGTRVNQVLTPEALRRLIRERHGQLTLAELASLLEAELGLAYGNPWDWRSLSLPRGGAEAALRQSLQLACSGDGPGGEVLWQTVLAPALSLASALRRLAPAGAGASITTGPLFFLHGPLTAANAEKLLALIDAGLVRIVTLGQSYRFESREQGVIIEQSGAAGVEQAWHFDWLVDARGQPGAYAASPEPLARALVAHGELALSTGLFAGLRIDQRAAKWTAGDLECARIPAPLCHRNDDAQPDARCQHGPRPGSGGLARQRPDHRLAAAVIKAGGRAAR
ncbi:MAG: FAD/NAD(P)-binding protein, partial [Rhodocyclales bacterium]|nr:FAD/NAD(P)-binding protein [Rhodocyclales bacterium]